LQEPQHARVAEMLLRREREPQAPGIKVNLYRDYEYRALAEALERVQGAASMNIETVMVGDSYFMTHLGRSSTNLSPEDSQLAFDLLPKLIAELRVEIDQHELTVGRPLLMADIPSGLDEAQTRAIIQRFADEGADIVKAEAVTEDDLWPLDAIREVGLLGALHLGYTPQSGVNRTYGLTTDEVGGYLRMLTLGRERHGASFVILERLAEVANVVLTRHAIALGLLPYSIFSGRAPFGGQSLNIWDAVVKSEKSSIFFPPTAYLERAEVESKYATPAIARCIERLLKLTRAGIFPPSPNNRLDVDTCLGILSTTLDPVL
jgi:ketopantoate hydroxymethyltransferase